MIVTLYPVAGYGSFMATSQILWYISICEALPDTSQPLKPGLLTVVRVTEHACDDASKRILKPLTYRLQIFIVRDQYLQSLLSHGDQTIARQFEKHVLKSMLAFFTIYMETRLNRNPTCCVLISNRQYQIVLNHVRASGLVIEQQFQHLPAKILCHYIKGALLFLMISFILKILC